MQGVRETFRCKGFYSIDVKVKITKLVYNPLPVPEQFDYRKTVGVADAVARVRAGGVEQIMLVAFRIDDRGGIIVASTDPDWQETIAAGRVYRKTHGLLGWP